MDSGAPLPGTQRSVPWVPLLLLPGLLLAWPGPGAILEGVSQHVLTGTALALLASLPLALFLAWRGRPRRVLALPVFLLVAALAFARSAGGNLTDTLEADRALAALSTHLLFLMAGASLSGASRQVLGRALPGLALLWLSSAVITLLSSSRGDAAGVLGNTGDLAEAAVPGAAMGLVLAADATLGRSPVRWLALAGVLGVVAYVALVPVHGAAWALAAAALLAAWRQGRGRPVRALPLAMLSLVLLALPLLHLGAEASHAPDPAPGSVATSSAPLTASATPRPTTGGLEVRRRIWMRLPRLLRDATLLGPGPGQFPAAFPPHRDPLEIELSTHNRSVPFETAVEHIHNDWLQGLSEGGLLGGAAWILFLLAVLYRSLVPVPEENPYRAGARCACLAILVLAFFNAPLFYSPGTSPLAFALFGWVLSGDRPATGRAGRLLMVGAALLLVLQAPRALAIFRHGLAHTPQEALAACPDSVPARSLLAHREAAAGPDRSAEALSAWEAVLARRPHALDALIGAGNIHARAGDLVGARHYFERARLVDAAHPGLLRNLVTLELDAGRLLEAQAPLERLRADGRLDLAWARGQGTRRLSAGQAREGLFLLEAADALDLPDGLAAHDGDGFYAASARAGESGDEALAKALRCHAHRLWATEQALAGDFATAVRSLRQSLASARPPGAEMSGGAPCITLELAAALVGAGSEAEARDQLADLRPRPQDLASLAPWAGQILLEAGLLGADR
jgi:O-antigen ligase